MNIYIVGILFLFAGCLGEKAIIIFFKTNQAKQFLPSTIQNVKLFR